MSFGDNELRRDMDGPEVQELQLRLAGFRGTIWDGDFGPGTELQVMTFQKEFMGETDPDGIVGEKTFAALNGFKEKYDVNPDKLLCPCGECNGFGNGRFSGQYRKGKPEIEAYHKREYPGVHIAVIESYRAARFYAEQAGLDLPFITSGYRCWVNNNNKGRKSTNHMGKALDCDIPMKDGEDKRDDCNRCDCFRSILAEKCNFQIGWQIQNRKALEPSNIAPSWIHMDVRCYSPKYLDDRFFVKV